MTKPKAVILLSGGMDSATLVALAQKKQYAVYPLAIYYGQRHKRELSSARALAVHWGLDLQLVDLSSLQQVLGGSALTSPEVEVPEGHYADPTMKATVVPNRNAIFLSIAWGYAVSLGAELVGYAAHAGDHPIYPDCRPDFAIALEVALTIGNRGYGDPNLHLWTPFIKSSKGDIAALGSDLEVPFDLTWSCYQGRDLHCGVCGTCIERREAFAEAGIPDPTIYAPSGEV